MFRFASVIGPNFGIHGDRIRFYNCSQREAI